MVRRGEDVTRLVEDPSLTVNDFTRQLLAQTGRNISRLLGESKILLRSRRLVEDPRREVSLNVVAGLLDVAKPVEVDVDGVRTAAVSDMEEWARLTILYGECGAVYRRTIR